MGMTIDDMYDWLYRLKSELVVYMPKEWHEPMKDSIQSAIVFSRKYQMLQADYENRLKADLVAMLTEIQLECEENTVRWYVGRVDGKSDDVVLMETINDIIQQKINALKGE